MPAKETVVVPSLLLTYSIIMHKLSLELSVGALAVLEWMLLVFTPKYLTLEPGLMSSLQISIHVFLQLQTQLYHLVLEHLALEHLALEHLALEHLALEHLALEHLALEHLVLDHLALEHLVQEHLVLEHLDLEHLVLEHLEVEVDLVVVEIVFSLLSSAAESTPPAPLLMEMPLLGVQQALMPVGIWEMIGNTVILLAQE